MLFACLSVPKLPPEPRQPSASPPIPGSLNHRSILLSRLYLSGMAGKGGGARLFIRGANAVSTRRGCESIFIRVFYLLVVVHRGAQIATDASVRDKRDCDDDG